MNPSRFRSVSAPASIENEARASHGFRVIACLLPLLLSPLFAQLTVDYDEDEVDANTYDTSAPNDPLTLSVAAGSATQSGQLTGTGAVIKTGAGTLVLSGDNSFEYGATVNDGRLVVAHNNALGNSFYANAAFVEAATAVLEIRDDITLSDGIGVSNGGTVENAGVISGLFGISSAGSTGANIVNTGKIEASFWDSIYVQDGIGTVKNTGGIIMGDLFAIALRDGGTLRNEGAAVVESTGYSAIYGGQLPDNSVSANAVEIENVGGSIISGWDYAIDLYSGGTVLNDGGSTIETGEEADGSAAAIAISRDAVVHNLGASTIKGWQRGILLFDGGSVTNGEGSTIETTGGNSGIDGVAIGGGLGSVDNLDTSTITGSRRGVWLRAGGTVMNEGIITGAIETGATHAGVRFSDAGVGELFNHGTINGGC